MIPNQTSSERRVPGTKGRFVREEIRAVLDPESFLRWGEGSPRGFWARGAGWIAHVGELASIEVQRAPEGSERFRHVSERARELLPGEEGSASPARLYGGFAFRADHEPTGFWEGFPSARFLLPELELERTPEGVVLRVQARIEEDGDEARLRADLRERLEEVRRAVHDSAASRCGKVAAAADAQPRTSAGAAVGLDEAGASLADPAGNGSSRPPTARVPLFLEDPGPPGRHARQRAAWEATVSKALAAIRAEEVEKVVLARTLDVTPAEPLDPVDVFVHLRRENTGAHVFFFEPVPGAPFLGAAPETVVTLLDGDFRATAVAGSASGGESREERSEFARQLLRSGKDRVEHAYTVQEIMRCLSPLAEGVSVDSEPHVLSLARIQHLETRVRARARDGQTVLSLLAALHPTPAVCGLPRDAALEFLREEERFERGWYAGPVGWFDAAGNGVFVPALRSAVAAGGTWRLIAGAGIVPGSEPGPEWDETGMKFQPVLRALARSGRIG